MTFLPTLRVGGRASSRHRPGWTLLAGPHAAVLVFRSHRPLGLAVAARHALVAAGVSLDIFVLPLALPSGRVVQHGCSPSLYNDPDGIAVATVALYSVIDLREAAEEMSGTRR